MVNVIPVFQISTAGEVDAILNKLTQAGYPTSPAVIRQGWYTYFDTQEGILNRLGANLRWEAGQSNWQLLKNGMVQAEHPASRDPTALPEEGFLPVKLKQKLIAFLEARIEERIYCLPRPGGGEFTLAVQQCNFAKPAGKSWRKSHLLMSLASALPDDAELVKMAVVVRDWVGLKTAGANLLEIGLGVLGAPVPGTPDPAETRLSPADTERKAAGKILRRQAFRMWANTEGTVLDLDPEFLHDLRVATRRARFALRLFMPVVGLEKSTELRNELTWLAELLGKVRDLDVFLDQFQRQLHAVEAPEETRQQIVQALQAERRRCRDELTAAMQSPRYQRLLETLRQLDIPDATPAAPADTVIIRSPTHIAQAMKKVLKLGGEQLAEGYTPNCLHQLRIAFKRLRYTCEFLHELFPKELDETIATGVAFQNCLGAYQDARVALRRLQAMAATDAPVKTGSGYWLVLGALIQIQREKADRQQARFESMWRKKSGRIKRHLKNWLTGREVPPLEDDGTPEIKP